jgi:tight adherence protein B
MDGILIYVIGFGCLLLIIALVVGIFITLTRDREVQNRIDRFTEGERISAEQRKEAQKSTPVMTSWINERVGKSSFGENLARDLARADLKMKPGEYILLMVISALGFGFVIYFIGGKELFAGLIGIAIGLFVPRFYMNGQKAKRLQKFNDQLGDMLNLMVNGLRAGYSVMQAMEAVSKELPAPISDEFRRVVQEMQLGVSMQQSLDNLLRRIPSEDLDLCITAINVQREVGGNLAEILDTISFTIRERVRIKGEIRVLTTQVMYSGRLLALLPIGVMGILYVLNREYMMEFFNPKNNSPLPCGYMGLACAGILIVVGYVVMNKIGEIEV